MEERGFRNGNVRSPSNSRDSFLSFDMNKSGSWVSTSLNVGVVYERSKVDLKLWYRTGVKVV